MQKYKTSNEHYELDANIEVLTSGQWPQQMNADEKLKLPL